MPLRSGAAALTRAPSSANATMVHGSMHSGPTAPADARDHAYANGNGRSGRTHFLGHGNCGCPMNMRLATCSSIAWSASGTKDSNARLRRKPGSAAPTTRLVLEAGVTSPRQLEEAPGRSCGAMRSPRLGHPLRGAAGQRRRPDRTWLAVGIQGSPRTGSTSMHAYVGSSGRTALRLSGGTNSCSPSA